MIGLALTFLALHPAPGLLEHVQHALAVQGGARWEQVRLAGKATYFGVEDSYELRFEPGGRFVETFKGPIGESFGFDGTTLWEVDRSNGIEKLDFEDRDTQIAVNLVLTSGWMSPKAPIKVLQKENELVLKLDSSGKEEILKIDPKTWLPTEASLPISSGQLKIKLDVWKPAGATLVPTQVALSDGVVDDSITIQAVEKTTVAPGDFQTPAWNPSDVQFDPAKPARIESKLAISGHMLVHPTVNGKDIGWFILDSGAEVMVIDQTAADEMKIDKIGLLPLTGVGGTVKASFRRVDDFTLGPATLRGILFTELDLKQIGTLLGIKLGGIVGADFMRRAVVTMDFKGHSVDVQPRTGFSLASGTWIPVRFSTGNPAVEATIAGAPKSWFRFDTGANGTVTLHSPFVKKYKLLDGVATTNAGQGGVGGIVAAKAGHVKWFELAGHRFDNPLVVFATGEKGAFAEPYLAGNIGQDFMKPFKVVLDFSGYRIALLPRE